MQADKTKVLKNLKIVRGQIDGLIKMVEEDRYCIDISNQLMASSAILNSTNKTVLQAHIQHCIKQAIETNDQEKIKEVLDLLDKLGNQNI